MLNSENSARAGKKEGGWGEEIFARPRSCPVVNAKRSTTGVSVATEFRISLCEIHRLLIVNVSALIIKIFVFVFRTSFTYFVCAFSLNIGIKSQKAK